MGILDFFTGIGKGLLLEKNKRYVVDIYRGEIDNKLYRRDYVRLAGYRVYYEKFLYVLDLYKEVFRDRLYDFETAERKPVFFDLGANIGMATLRLKQLYPDAKVVCFEPQARAFELLSRNVRENRLSDVTLHNLAVSDHEGEITFYSEPGTGSCPGAGIIRMDGFVESKMRCVRVSDYVDGRVDLLKIDIEGSELTVLSELAAAGKLKLVERVFLEYHPDTDSFIPLAKLLGDNGFRWRVYSPERVKPADRPDVCMIYATR